MKLRVIKTIINKEKQYIEVEVDDDMYRHLSRFEWRVSIGSRQKGAIMASIRGKFEGQELHLELGRTILGLPDGVIVKTLGDKYDYRRNNLYQPSWGREAGRRFTRNCDGTYG